MPDINVEEILQKVKENKQALTQRTEELEAAQSEIDRLHEVETTLKQELQEKDEAIQDLLNQMQEGQEQIADLEGKISDIEQQMQDKDRLAKELKDLLG